MNMFNLFKRSELISYVNVSPEEFKTLVDKKEVVVVDVRTAIEVAAGKIKGAKNIDIMSENFVNHLEGLDRSKTYLLYCKSGYRSAQAASKMANMGFKHLYSLKGGISSWPYELSN